MTRKVIFDPDRVVLIADHAAPAPNVQAAEPHQGHVALRQ
jgi:hypothetical protein